MSRPLCSCYSLYCVGSTEIENIKNIPNHYHIPAPTELLITGLKEKSGIQGWNTVGTERFPSEVQSVCATSPLST
jgi:hypothetical protein